MRTASVPNVLIRNLDPAVHSVLIARAAARGQSLQQYLTDGLTRPASQPTLAELFTEIEQRPPRHVRIGLHPSRPLGSTVPSKRFRSTPRPYPRSASASFTRPPIRSSDAR